MSAITAPPLDGGELPDDLRARVKPELAPGERLLWAGKSKPARELSGRSYAIIYAIGFAVISVASFAGLFGWFGPVIKRMDGLLGTLGVCAAVISFLISIGVTANIVHKRSERRTLSGNVYALTDARAIVWVPLGGGVSVHSIRRGEIKAVHRVEYDDGSGSVYFDGASPEFTGAGTGFHEIPDARNVEALVRLHLIGDDRGPSA